MTSFSLSSAMAPFSHTHTLAYPNRTPKSSQVFEAIRASWEKKHDMGSVVLAQQTKFAIFQRFQTSIQLVFFSDSVPHVVMSTPVKPNLQMVWLGWQRPFPEINLAPSRRRSDGANETELRAPFQPAWGQQTAIESHCPGQVRVVPLYCVS